MLGGVGPVRCATLNLDEAFWELTGFGFVGTPKLSEWEAGAIPGWWEAFWELTGFGFVGTPKLSELEAGAIPGWVTTLGSCSVSSQKQNRAGCIKFVPVEIYLTFGNVECAAHLLFVSADPVIGLGRELKGSETFVDLAILCLEDLQAKRPRMGEVVKEIEDIIHLTALDTSDILASTSGSSEDVNKEVLRLL
ncbi:hypothetical protein L3X38_024122 [Prunus dulcis]|uniref:Uncharacterized protein n=1 Tax=Prunus dulcis TaxID=3755 RepID=A0AAD4VZ81_PRUDU|nr:hypothetical protein L3X38_024122 [Prunus dulcis]